MTADISSTGFSIRFMTLCAPPYTVHPGMSDGDAVRPWTEVARVRVCLESPRERRSVRCLARSPRALHRTGLSPYVAFRSPLSSLPSQPACALMRAPRPRQGLTNRSTTRCKSPLSLPLWACPPSMVITTTAVVGTVGTTRMRARTYTLASRPLHPPLRSSPQVPHQPGI